MIHAADWLVPGDGPPIRHGAVRIADGRIAEVGEDDGRADESFPGCVILPALVDAHTHLEYQAMGGFGDGLPFDAWIADHIVRRRAIGEREYAAQARAGVQDCLAGGIGTVADCCYAGTVAAAAAKAGLRAIVYLEAFSSHDPLGEPLEQRLRALPAHPLVTPGVSPHAPYTVTHDDYRRLVALARERGLPVATHLLESHVETEPLAAFADVLGPDTVAIHLARAEPDDVAAAARLDVPVVHCPRSNALLGCGTAPVRELLDAGVRVGLGTDSPASAPGIDMWEEMRAAVMAARARARRADALAAADALALATAGGAAALGLGGITGALRPGLAGDLCVLDLAGSGLLPAEDPVAAAVYGGRPERVLVTMVEGRVRYRRGDRPADDAVAAAAEGARARMIAI